MPKDLIDHIKQSIDQALADVPKPAIAAFDADGTLWDTDMGENFFLYQIQEKLIEGLPENPWEHYWKLKKEVSPKVAYLWLAQINKGVPLSTVRTWSQDCVDRLRPLPIFPGQKDIIDHLHDKGVDVYVVTASIKWSVEAAASLYGIPQDRVLGITTKVENGIVTDVQAGPITWREGKVKGLLLATGNRHPFFASGNTPGDLALLESSTHLRLAMAATDKDTELFAEEMRLVEIAKERKWFYFLP